MKYLNKLYRWLFTDEERAFIPDLVGVIVLAVGISWWICSFMLHQRDMLWIDELEAKDEHAWSVITNLTDRINEVEHMLNYYNEPVNEPCCVIAEQQLRELESKSGICDVITTADSTVTLPGLPINIGDLFDEMCSE
jgi:hypothetical protein